MLFRSVDAFETEYTDGAFDDAVKPGALEKLIAKLRAALDSGEKFVFVY